MVFTPALTVTEWPSVQYVPSQTDYSNSVHWKEHAPLLIDNGRWMCLQQAPLSYARVSRAAPTTPRPMRIPTLCRDSAIGSVAQTWYFAGPNAMSMRKDAVILRAHSTVMWCVALTRWCVAKGSQQEHMLDYTFSKLGIDTPRVDHPLLLTETLCSPDYSRSRT